MDRKPYDSFVKELDERLRTYHPALCHYRYGSFFENRFDPSTASDIDGGFICDAAFVTDKEEVKALSRTIASCAAHNRVPYDFNLLDRGTNKDGRFLSYSKGYTDWITNPTRGGVICGPDFLQEMEGCHFRSDELREAAYNFRRVRNSVLMMYDERATDHALFIEHLRRTVKDARKFPKKLLALRDPCTILSSVSAAREKLHSLVPAFDSTRHGYLDTLLERVYRTPLPDAETCITFYCEGLGAIEQMIGAYAAQFPPCFTEGSIVS